MIAVTRKALTLMTMTRMALTLMTVTMVGTETDDCDKDIIYINETNIGDNDITTMTVTVTK